MEKPLKKFALVTDEGTAADETTLCENHLSEKEKVIIPEDVINLEYVDVSLNEQCCCIVCRK